MNCFSFKFRGIQLLRLAPAFIDSDHPNLCSPAMVENKNLGTYTKEQLHTVKMDFSVT
jgi:hypothetical protein